MRQANNTPYFETILDYRANILNAKAEAFYRRHGVKEMVYGLEKTLDYDGKALMTTKYCLRYELGMCLKEHPETAGDLFLRNNRNRFRLVFDCRQCEMQILP